MATEFSIVSNNELEVGGTRMFFDDGKTDSLFRGKNREDAYYMAKSRWYLEAYKFINDTLPITRGRELNMVELGIYNGGSAVFFDKLYNPKKLVCIDFMKEPAAALSRYIREGAGERVRPFYGTDQADNTRVREIIESEFQGPIDLVVDDASHWYEQSRSSFETIFPYMRPGGLFILEDWTWAHGEAAQKPDYYWGKKTALTNLVFRMVMAHATSMAVISRIMMVTGMVVVERGSAKLPKDWTLAAYEKPRGVELSLI